MDPLQLAAWSFPALLVLIFLRVPIGLSMLFVGLLGAWQVYGSWAPLLNQLKTLRIATEQALAHLRATLLPRLSQDISALLDPEADEGRDGG